MELVAMVLRWVPRAGGCGEVSPELVPMVVTWPWSWWL